MRKRKIFNILWILSILLWTHFGHAQQWELVWSDDFSGTEIDGSRWSHEVNGYGGGNNELQYYTDRSVNSFVENGHLVIQALKESYTGPDGTRNYTSARLRTIYKGDWKYGKFEIRAKLPFGQGLWPAIWMMPTDNVYGGWAASGEIDIMELIGQEPDVVYGTLHYGGSWPNNVHSGYSYTLPSGNFSDDYHLFTLEWEPTEMRWYVDGILYATQSSWYTSGFEYPAPFDQRFYMILNVAVGGNWPGSPDGTTVFPQRMEVDYVKVYRDAAIMPIVEITSPPNNSTITGNSALTVQASASDQDGSINAVEFFQSEALLGEDTTPPYEVTLNDIASGVYQIRARATDNSGNQSWSPWVQFIVDSVTSHSPFFITPAQIPGIVEVENYDNGGEGNAYHDSNALNEGNNMQNVFRSAEGVDLQPCSDAGGGSNLGWIEPGEWIRYTVNVQHSGTYNVKFRVSSESGGGALDLRMNGSSKTGYVIIPSSGGWQSWTNLEKQVSLTRGVQTMEIYAYAGGFNLNYIEFEPLQLSADDDVSGPEFLLNQNYPNPFNPVTVIPFYLDKNGRVKLEIFNALGQMVETVLDNYLEAGYHEITISGSGLSSGVYYYKLTTRNQSAMKKMLILK